MLRRLLAITLLIAFGLPLAAQVLASSSDPDARLPACCRMHGKHHCAMAMGFVTTDAPAFQSPPCPAYPNPATQANAPVASLHTAKQTICEAAREASPATKRAFAARVFAASAHLTRGPPSLQS